MKAKPPSFEQLYQIEVCRAVSGCPNSNLEAGPLAAALKETFSQLNFTAWLRERLAGQPVLYHHIFRVSISGCPNACSRPQIADFGLIGQVEPILDPEACTGCAACAQACPEGAIVMVGVLPALDRERCLLCGNCIRACASGALYAGRKGLAIMAGGRLGRRPQLALRLADLALPQEALGRMRDLLESYLKNARPGERLGSYLERCEIFAELGG